jgi:predicted transposase/invertase (TIGR01784 family)
MKIKGPDGKTICECSFNEIVLEDYTFEQLLSIDKRLIILAPFTVSKRLKKAKRISLCHEWATNLKKIYPKAYHHNALDILSLFILNRFRNLTLEEVQTMLNFDISNTVAGKQLIEIGTQIGAKQGVKQGLMNTASKMLKKGFEPYIIKEITGLSDKDIKKLLN